MIPKRPLLAATIESEDDLANLQFPIWISKKYDGIRAITTGSGVVSRTLKPIPNRFINSSLSGLPAGIEGELIVGDGSDFEATESGVMCRTGKPNFLFYVFDWFGKSKFTPYRKRIANLQSISSLSERVRIIEQYICEEIEQIVYLYEDHIKQGAEGIMLRDPNGFYKFGRSTLAEQLLIKYKPWNTDEAVVVDILEEMGNNNELEQDERGYAKRSRKIANLQGKGTMGALLCKNKRFGQFKLGSGFCDRFSKLMWDKKEMYLGKELQFRYRGITKYGKPKHASFERWL